MAATSLTPSPQSERWEVGDQLWSRDAMLYGRVKFCPYCGKAEYAALGAGAAKARIEPERGTPPDQSGTVEAIAVDCFVMPSPVLVPVPVPRPVGGAQEEVGSGLARFDSAAPGWQQDLPAPISTPTVVARPAAVRKPLAIGKVAALVLIGLAMMLVALYVNNQIETDREFRAKLAQARSALGGGDVSGAQRALAALAAADPDDPDVRAFWGEVDQRMREQAAPRKQLREASMNAAEALRLGDPAQSPAKAPAAEQPFVAVRTPGIGAVQPRENACNDALAALALCP